MQLTVSSLAELDVAVKSNERSDYIYMYPPRQAYRELPGDDLTTGAAMSRSLARFDTVNLYIHVPFCRQICGFCNLFTTTLRSEDVHAAYLSAVERQLAEYRRLQPRELTVSTIYVGGGTPTLLDPAALGSLLDAVTSLWPMRAPGCEVAIEVDPQTVDGDRLRRLRTVGFNRVNLGLQSTSTAELRIIGRRYDRAEQALRVHEAMDSGFDNVCVDLIYGLPAQSQAEWDSSVADCIALGPHTICCYPLTSRPHTGFARRGLAGSDADTYAMWTAADAALTAAGYRRQSHVRWARSGGGYLQKQLHWGMQNVLGAGAGARSYLWETDLRSGYSVLDAASVVRQYIDGVGRGDFLPRQGFAMDDDERLRKAVVLGLLDLDARRCAELVGTDPCVAFDAEFAALAERGLLEFTPAGVRLTQRGTAYRDLVVQLFFSERVRSSLRGFSYAE